MYVYGAHNIFRIMDNKLTGMYRGYDIVTDKIWDRMNKGVCNSERWQQSMGHGLIFSAQRQWKDIRARYIEADGDDE